MTYGFHPDEDYSYEVGKKLEKNPPKNTDVIYFRPSSIDENYLALIESERITRTDKGSKELRQHALEVYKKLPFIIELHDTPLYGSGSSHYGLIYPSLNSRLGKIFEEYTKTRPSESIMVIPHRMVRATGYYSTTIEYWPTKFFREEGNFETLTVEKGEVFARNVIGFLQKNRNRY